MFFKECIITEKWNTAICHQISTHKIVHSSAMYYQNLNVIHDRERMKEISSVFVFQTPHHPWLMLQCKMFIFSTDGHREIRIECRTRATAYILPQWPGANLESGSDDATLLTNRPSVPVLNKLTLWSLGFKHVELWCLCCMMMFRRVNKQPGMQRFWHLCCYYQDIYDWISPFNKPYGTWSILTLQSMGEISMVFPVTCIFSLFNAFEVQFFQGFIFTPYHRHW